MGENEDYVLEISSVIENAPYLFAGRYDIAYSGKSSGNSTGNSSSSSHSSNSSSHSASRAQALSINEGLYKVLMINLGNCNSQSKCGNSSSGSKSKGPSSSKGFSREQDNIESRI